MAGDWIKIEHSLPNKPEVMQLASLLGVDELQIVGHLVCFWIWCDQNLSRSCPDANGTSTGQQGGPEKRREEKSNTLSLYDEPSLVSKLPDWAAPDWVRWMDLIFQLTGRRMPAIQQEAVAMEVMRRGPDKGLADLQFTIKVGAKTLQDASNDYTKPRVPAAASVGPKAKKEVSF